MGVCVFPDCRGGSLEGMRPLSSFADLKYLLLGGVHDNLIYGQDGQNSHETCVVNLLKSLKTLKFSGELW